MTTFEKKLSVTVDLATSTLPQAFNTAVLFLVFNRLDTTKQVFSEIREAKPPRFYIASDGARTSREGEDIVVQSIRDYLKNNIDWECEVKTLFRDKNLGCKHAVSEAITWFFENEEMGIILEDDCLPDATFFYFCQELLERYRDDQRIGMISGDNFQFGNRRNDDSYYFSKYVHIWGWATWRDRWIGSYDVTMAKWSRVRDEGLLIDILGSRREAGVWQKTFEKAYCSEIDTWDYQWVFANFLEGRMSILPNVNMISNVGFNEAATHTLGESDLANIPRHAVEFPLIHPLGFIINRQADLYTGNRYIHVSLMSRIINKLMKLFR